MSPAMRQGHAGGEKMFVDFAGDTIDVVDPTSGEIWQVRLFVACMGASRLVFAEARAGEGLAGCLDGFGRQDVPRRPQLLPAHDVGPSLLQPIEQAVRALVHVDDVEDRIFP